jgi:hypothetical protein
MTSILDNIRLLVLLQFGRYWMVKVDAVSHASLKETKIELIIDKKNIFVLL